MCAKEAHKLGGSSGMISNIARFTLNLRLSLTMTMQTSEVVNFAKLIGSMPRPAVPSQSWERNGSGT